MALTPVLAFFNIAGSGAPGAVNAITCVLFVGQVVAGCVVIDQSTNHLLSTVRPDVPRVRPDGRWILALVIGTIVALAWVLVIPRYDLSVQDNGAEFLIPLIGLVTLASASALFAWPWLLLGAVGVGAVSALAGHLQRLGSDGVLALGVSMFLAGFGVSATFRLSVWMLKVVWQIDSSRGTEKALAVAEERLRFARDLHDVLGRNLSVMALKSELAAELVRRQRPEAAEEISAVNAIAQESLREFRAVVRGYRRANLATELAGARGVLEAAGIDCRIAGDHSALPDPVQAAFGWVVRETTTNVLRHSQAQSCRITLSVDGADAVLIVDNDGAPAPVAESGTAAITFGSGSGLAGLAERLAGLGGRLDARHAERDHYRVRASLPLTAVEVAAPGTESAPGDASGSEPDAVTDVDSDSVGAREYQ